MSEQIVNTFILLFVVVDPVGLMPMFLALSVGADAAEQRRTALRGVALAALILVVFALLGDAMLRVLGIGLPAFQIAGGALLFLLAIDMVFARQSGLRSTTRGERHEAEQRRDISVFPLAFPLIAGPGALTTILLLTAGVQHRPDVLALVLGVAAVVLLVTLGLLLLARPVMAVLGATGANVVGRVLGLLLAALAVQFMVDGVLAVAAAARSVVPG